MKEYRWIRGKDADALVDKLNEESRAGEWTVVAIHPRGETWVAFLHGFAHPKLIPVVQEDETPAQRAIREEHEAQQRHEAELDKQS